MFSKIELILSAVLGLAANLLRYPSPKGNGHHGTENDPGRSIHPSGGSPLGDWLTQTVSYHH